MRITILIALFFITHSLFSQRCSDIMEKMFASIDQLQTASFHIIAKERFFDQYKIEKGFYKLRKNPYAIYYKQLIPPSYAEVLMNDKHKINALVYPNSFPFTSIKLSPYGEKLRERQHHNLYQAGFDYFKMILSEMKKKYSTEWDDVCEYHNLVLIKNKSCYKLTLINPYYKLITYTLDKKTTAQKLALKLNLCDYKIIELNPTIKSIFVTIPTKSTLVLPTDYAQKITLYIDQNNYLPIKIEVYDEKGLFEEYLFENIKINPTFTDKDFDENNPEYGFK